MIPLKDDNPTENFPYVTVALLIINVIVFVMQLVYAKKGVSFTAQLAVIPARFSYDSPAALDIAGLAAFWVHRYVTLVSYSFLHGGFMHLAFNMLFLWIFGNNVEDALGHVKFILFYIFSAVIAALLHVLLHFGAVVPLVGASGAIAGILGAYVLLYPRAQIYTLVILFIFIRIIKVPAILFIGFWFFIQIMNATGGAGSNIAWYTHIGGFVTGVILIILFRPKRKKKRRLNNVYH